MFAAANSRSERIDLIVSCGPGAFAAEKHLNLLPPLGIQADLDDMGTDPHQQRFFSAYGTGATLDEFDEIPSSQLLRQGLQESGKGRSRRKRVGIMFHSDFAGTIKK